MAEQQRAAVQGAEGMEQSEGEAVPGVGIEDLLERRPLDVNTATASETISGELRQILAKMARKEKVSCHQIDTKHNADNVRALRAAIHPTMLTPTTAHPHTRSGSLTRQTPGTARQTPGSSAWAASRRRSPATAPR